MYFVYVLRSTITRRLYIGSSENPLKRLMEHNSGCVQSTKPYRPYIIVYTESYEAKSEGVKREKQLKKSGRMRKELKKKVTNMALSSNG